jgi:putative heme-binding domain-containing protein
MPRVRTALLVLGLLLIHSSGFLAAQTRTATPAGGTDLAAGRKVFDAQCAWCHGTDGTGGTGPNLQGRLIHATDLKSIVEIITSGIPGTEMPSFRSPLTERSIRQAATYVRSLSRTASRTPAGDTQRGAALYESNRCGGCHVVNGAGGILGPELTSIGARRGPPYLREALVTPEATHPPGYLVVKATMADGQDVRGIRVTEDVFWIHIRDAAGNVHALEKAKLQKVERELTATLMPSYASRLSSAQLDDLVAYLSSLRGAR